MGECGRGQALQDETDGVTFLRLAQHAEGIVDVALAVTDCTQQRGGEVKVLQNFGQDRVVLGIKNIRYLETLLNMLHGPLKDKMVHK